MAKKATAKAEAEPTPPVVDHGSPAHDWRNPAARFDPSDHCVNAELARLARR